MILIANQTNPVKFKAFIWMLDLSLIKTWTCVCQNLDGSIQITKNQMWWTILLNTNSALIWCSVKSYTTQESVALMRIFFVFEDWSSVLVYATVWHPNLCKISLFNVLCWYAELQTSFFPFRKWLLWNCYCSACDA